MQEIIKQVVNWGKEKGIVQAKNFAMQENKIAEEIVETENAYLHKNKEKLKDGIGDVAVTVILRAAQNGFEVVNMNFEVKNKNKPGNENIQANIRSLYFLHYLIKMNCRKKKLREIILEFMATLDDLAAACELTLKECLEMAYNEIKDRQGSLKNGSFIKESK